MLSTEYVSGLRRADKRLTFMDEDASESLALSKISLSLSCASKARITLAPARFSLVSLVTSSSFD